MPLTHQVVVMCRSLRGALRRSLYLALLLVLLFGTLTAFISIRYRVSPVAAAVSLLKQITLTSIGAAVEIHDPCAATLAQTGPSLDELPNHDDYARIEDVLLSSAIESQSIHAHPEHIHNARIVHATYPFRYQGWNEPKLRQLRERYRLDEVVAKASTEVEAMTLLRSWTRGRFRRKDYQPATDNFDALEILDRDLRNVADEPLVPGRHLDPCHFFPLLYAQVMLSMGYQSRLVSITHGMAEVWSNEHEKWVLMDADLDLHYEVNNIPLSLVEVYELNYAPKPWAVRFVHGTQSSGDKNAAVYLINGKEVTIEGMVAYHRTNLDLVEMRNDWLTNHYFRGHPARNELNSLVYCDPRLNKPLSFDQRLRRVTCKKEDLYWTLNQVEIFTAKTLSARTLQLGFKTVTPNFDYFEITIDDNRKIQSASPAFAWQLHEGINSIAVRPVNQAGIRGVASTVKLPVN